MKNTSLKKIARGQSGMSLVEVMVAMLLGLFLVGGMMQVFTSSRLTYRVHESTARMQETGRMALEVLSRDIRMADFWGCASDLTNIVNNLDNTGSGYIDFGTGGVVGTEGGPGVPDSLMLRGGSNAGLGVQPPYGPQASANIKVQAGSGLEQGDILFVSDCSNGDIFQITNANPDDGGVLVHNTGSATEPGNYNATNPGCPGSNAHCLSKVYGADASVFTAREISYSVGVGSEGEPALFRNGQEYLDGVEDLQILYGEDTDPPGSAGSGAANYYVPANQVVDMLSVISLRFAVVVRSSADNLTGGVAQNYTVLGAAAVAPDTRLRQVYTSTVTVRNRL
jgi:type IV pilus assembly protein PilW